MGIDECGARTRSNSPAFAAQWLAEGSDSLRCHRARGLLSRRSVGLRRVGSVKDTGSPFFPRAGAPDCVSTERMPVSQVARSIPAEAPRIVQLREHPPGAKRCEASDTARTRRWAGSGKNTTGPLHRAGAGQTGRPDVRNSRGDAARPRLPQRASTDARARSVSHPTDRNPTHHVTCPEDRGAQPKQPFETGKDKPAHPGGEAK